jgi:hypothetical protein
LHHYVAKPGAGVRAAIGERVTGFVNDAPEEFASADPIEPLVDLIHAARIFHGHGE